MNTNKNEYVHFYVRKPDSCLSISNYALDFDVTRSNFLLRSACIKVYTNIDKHITGLKTSNINDISHGFAICVVNKTRRPLMFRKTDISSFEYIIPIKQDFDIDAEQVKMLFYSEHHRGFVSERFNMISIKKDLTFYDAFFKETYVYEYSDDVCIDDLEYFKNITDLEIRNAKLHTFRYFKFPSTLKLIVLRKCEINIDIIKAFKDVKRILMYDIYIDDSFIEKTNDIGFRVEYNSSMFGGYVVLLYN